MTGVLAAPDGASQIAGLVFALLLVDPEHRIAEANPAAEDLLGRSIHRLVGLHLSEAVKIADGRVAEGMGAADAPLVARDVVVSTGAVQRHVNVTSSPLLQHPGWRVVTLSDAGTGLVERDDDHEVRAPAILAHEIKNPLAAIRGASQLLARRAEPRDRPLAEIVIAEADRIAGLIDRMQQLGRKAQGEPASCNLHEAIRSAVASVRAARGNEVAFLEEFDPSLPPVAADRAALEQIVINLLVNACDASASQAAPQVEVRTRFVSGMIVNVIRSGKARRLPIEILIVDNGPGIAAELRDHVFEPFVTDKPNGQGLGLALVRKLVRDMGGRISHERDEKARRTLFRINLALAGEHEA